jgi:hypothetical protein
MRYFPRVIPAEVKDLRGRNLEHITVDGGS